MAAPGVLGVEGVAALRRQLKAAGHSLADLKGANLDVAALVVREAQKRAPVRTGRLRGSLRPFGTTASAIVRGGGRPVPYAAPVHWGWPSRHIKANPFVLEAEAAVRDDIEARYMQAIEQAIDKIKRH